LPTQRQAKGKETNQTDAKNRTLPRPNRIHNQTLTR
jgi:hypothetical protein